VAFLGFLGEDPAGDLVRDVCRKEGIDIPYQWIDPRGTARSVNLVFRGGNRKNYYDGKSHMGLEVDLTECEEVFQRVKLVHFNLPNWARKLLPLAKEVGIAIARDIQDVVHLNDPYRQDFIQIADIVLTSGVNFASMNEIGEYFMPKNPNQIILIGRGNLGCSIITNRGARDFPAVEMNATVVDTNGAGDALAARFLQSFAIEGTSLEEAVLRGQILARHVCSQKAPKNNLLNHQQLDESVSQLRKRSADSTQCHLT